MRETLRRFGGRFGGDQRGATAVEFAMVITPFLFMLYCIFEFALVGMVTLSLDSATSEAARRIRTGEGQKSAMTAADFKTNVCGAMGWLQSECSGALNVDVRVFPTFANQTAPNPVSGGAFDQSNLQFAMGGPGDIVLVRTFYKWKLLTPALQSALSNVSGGIDVVTAQAVFRNEPYS